MSIAYTTDQLPRLFRAFPGGFRSSQLRGMGISDAAFTQRFNEGRYDDILTLTNPGRRPRIYRWKATKEQVQEFVNRESADRKAKLATRSRT